MQQMNKMATRRAGFTLIEIIVVVVIIGILALLIVPRVMNRVGESKIAVARSGAASLASAMQQFMIDNGVPESGASISVLFERPGNIEESKWKGPYVQNADDLKDPWGREFILRIPPEHNADFDILTYGADGQPGGTGENTDIVNGKRD